MTLTEKLQEIRAVCEAATPDEGDWFIKPCGIGDLKDICVRTNSGDMIIAEDMKSRDAAFFLKARTDVPMLLDMVEELLPEGCWCDNELMLQCEECTSRSKLEKIMEKHS